MKPIEDVRQISAITYGFMASKALFAALEFDLFTLIARGQATLSSLTRSTGVAENRMRTLVTALKTVGLVSEEGGRLANAPASEKYLVAGSPGDFREYVQFVNGKFGYEAARHLETALRGDRVFPDKGIYEGLGYTSGIGGERFSSAQHAGSLGPARILAKRVDLRGRQRLLDVAGGSGAYSITLCRNNPELRATILDFPETLDTARRYAREAGMGDRINHVGGNAITTEWPDQQDVVLMSYLWSGIGRPDIEIVAQRAAKALKPGGIVLVHDFMVDDKFEGPAFASWYLLLSVIDNPLAECLIPAFVKEVLQRAGFEVGVTEPMLEGITMLTTARKP